MIVKFDISKVDRGFVSIKNTVNSLCGFENQGFTSFLQCLVDLLSEKKRVLYLVSFIDLLPDFIGMLKPELGIVLV